MEQIEYNGQVFSVGDKVVVTGKTKCGDPNGMGDGEQWHNSWVDEMDGYVGKTLTICEIDPHIGVSFFEDDNDWRYGFPLNCLSTVH